MGDFELIPSIDLLAGRCVRLAQGSYDDATVYGDDPAALAAEHARHPIRRLHLVDLDGAKAGRPVNTETIRAIVESTGDVPVQLGGGLRSLDAVHAAIDLGVDRVVLGTVALREPEIVAAAAAAHPGRVVVGIDARDGRVAVEGWTETSETLAVDVAKRFADSGAVAIVYTDIARDGMGTGPNLEQTASLAESIDVPVIASGGVADEDDVLRAASYAPRGVAGVIVGRALYTGGVDVGRTLEKLACS